MLTPRLLIRLLALAALSAAFAQPSLAQDAPTLPPSVLPISDCPSALTPPDPMLLRYLDVRSTGGGRWRADNAEIAFTTNWTGTYQKWRMPATGGFPEQITFFPDEIAGCDFAPHDPELMLCGVAAGGNERTQVYIVSRDGVHVDPLLYDPETFHRIGDWSRDGRYISFARNDRDERYFDVWLADMTTGEQRLLWAPDKNLGPGRFSPDGRHVLCSDSISNFDNNLYLVDVQTAERTLLTEHEGVAVFNNPRWVDDHTIYLVSDLSREFLGLAKIDIRQPGKLEWVRAPEADVETMNVSPDGRYIGWSENHDGYEHVSLATLPDFLPLTAPALPRGIQSCGEFSWDSRQVLLQATGPGGPGDIFKHDLASGVTTRLTRTGTGGLDPATFVEPEVVEILSFDGLPISGLWYEPRLPKPAGGWPVIVEAHGGPEGQSQPYFSTQVQMYLSRGFAVLLPNPRGSTGFGKSFSHLDDIGKRLDSVQDYIAFRDWLVAQGHADPGRIAISGGSYGGYIVLATLAFHPDAFTCGVCQFGIANFVSFLENTAPHRRVVREAEYGFLGHDRALLEQVSPLNRIESVTAPLLIMQGANDPRVPLSESTQMYEALKARGRDVELLVFGDEGHGFVKQENRIISWSAELAFLTKHLGDAE